MVQNEVKAIREACMQLEKGYEPGITFVVVQKRHHTRFFPEQESDKVYLKEQGHVTANKLVISMIYIVAHTWPLCSAQILVGGVNPQ